MVFKDYIHDKGKKLLITDNISVAEKMIRRYSKDEAVYAVKVMNISQLAAQFYYAYLSIFKPDEKSRLIEKNMQSMRFLICMKNSGNDFPDEKSKNIATAYEILNSLRQIRCNQPTEEYENSGDKKIAGLKQLLADYESSLEKNDELDEVMLYRKTLAIFDEFEQKGNAGQYLMALMPDLVSAKIGYFFSEELTLLEEDLLSKMEKILQREAVRLESEHMEGRNYRFYKAYGIENEIRNIISIIEKEAINYGDLAVIYPATIYENTLRAEFGSRGIPYSFPKGFFAMGTEFVSLMDDLLDFAENDFSYEDIYRITDNDILRIKGAKKAGMSFLSYGIGYGRERYIDFFERYEKSGEKKEEYEPFLGFLKDVIGCFDEKNSCGQIYRKLLELVRKYTDDRDFYRACMKDVLNSYIPVLDLVEEKDFRDKISQIRNVLKRLKCRTSEDAGAVSILPYGNIEEIDRKYVFVPGLSVENVESIPLESPVLCDDEIKKYIKGHLRFAKDANHHKKALFQKTLEYSSAKEFYVSYSYYDLNKMLTNSPSVLFYEMLDKAGMSEGDIISVGYTPQIKDIIPKQPDDGIGISEEEYKYMKENARYFSASSLQTLLHCPMDYFYSRILKLPQPEFFERKPDQWLKANVRGDVFHHVMKKYVDKVILEKGEAQLNEKILEDYFNEEIRQTLTKNPFPSADIYEIEKKEAYEVLIKYINKLHEELNTSDLKKKVIGCEIDFEKLVYSAEGSFEIEFKGSVDRMDGYMDSDKVVWLQIYDYKTGSFKNKQQEIADGDQIQHHVYAIAMMAWARKNIDLLEKLFGPGIKDIKIGCMQYLFPYEEENGIIEAECSRDENGSPNLPEGLENVLKLIVAPIEQGNIEEALKYCSEIASVKKQEDTDDKFCRYCKNRDVCRV